MKQIQLQEYIPFGAMEQILIDKLGKRLGIPIADLILLEPELYADKLPGGDINGYTVKFKENAAQEVIDTIKIKNPDNTVTLAYYDIINVSDGNLPMKAKND